MCCFKRTVRLLDNLLFWTGAVPSFWNFLKTGVCVRSRTRRKMQTVSNLSIFTMLVMYMLSALFGYLTFYGKWSVRQDWSTWKEASHSFRQIGVFHIKILSDDKYTHTKTLVSTLQITWRPSCSIPLPRFTSSTPCCCSCAWLSSPPSLWPSPSCSFQWVHHAALHYISPSLYVLWRFMLSYR